MELNVSKYGITGASTEAVISHRGEELTWNVKLVDKASAGVGYAERNSKPTSMFEEINQFLKTLRPEVHDVLFRLYGEMYRAFEEANNKTDLSEALKPLIAEMYDYIKLDDVKHWVAFTAPGIKIPDNLLTVYSTREEMPGPPEQTYLRSDYIWLVALSVALRLMTPIWGEFINRTAREVGTTWKEYEAFKLLQQASIFHSIPMERLRVFSEAIIPPDKNLSAAIIDGISSDDFPAWVLALTAVRRLIVADISGQDPNQSLMGSIRRFMSSKVTGQQTSFMGVVKDKPAADSGGDEATNLSTAERYRMRQDLPAGDIAMMEHYINRFVELNPFETDDPSLLMEPTSEAGKRVYSIWHQLLSHRDDGRIVPKSLTTKVMAVRETEEGRQLLMESLDSIQKLDQSQHRIWPSQLTLIQWVLADLLSPRCWDYVSKETVLNGAAIAMAYLKYSGHDELAHLITASRIEDFDDLLGGPLSRSRIPKETVDELDRIYPFARRTGGRNPERQKNAAIQAIDQLEEILSRDEWHINVPQSWLTTNSRRYAVSQDIKIKLAKLIIDLRGM